MKKLSAGENSGFHDQLHSRPDAELSASNFYQFSEKPFENNPDPKFLYLTPSYQQIFASILTWIKEGNGFAVITGEAGTGKTYFIHALLSHLDEKITPILFLNPVVTFRDLLKQIVRALKQPIREKTETGLLHHFTKFLDQMMDQGKTLLIILDEAQGLNDRILDDIDRFLDPRSKPIRIIFVGQPHFDERLNSIGFGRLGQKIKTKQKIKLLTEEEVRGYIDHRLRLVGSSSEIMTSKAISMICSYARGVSSLINHVCDNALWVGRNMNRKKIDVDIIEKVIRNLQGPSILPITLSSIQRIWRSPAQFAIPSKTGATTIFSKVIQSLRDPTIIRKSLPSIQLRRIGQSLIQFAISFKRVSAGIFFQIIQNSQVQRIIPKALPSIQLNRIWKFPTRFASSFKRVLIAVLLKFIRSLECLTMLPKTFTFIQISRIWKPPIQLAVSLKHFSTAALLKVIRNLENLPIIAKTIPTKLRRIGGSPVQFSISLKIVLMAISLKFRQKLQTPRIIPRTLLSIQLSRVWENSVKIAISFKRALMAALIKIRHNLEGSPIIPKTLPSIQLRQIWKPPFPFAISFKRVSTAIFEVIQNLQVPGVIPKTLSTIQLKRIWKSPTQFAISFKRGLIATFFLVSLGGFIFLVYEYFGREPMNIQMTKPIVEQKLPTKPPTHTPPVQGTTRGILEKYRIQTSDEPKLTQTKSSFLKRDTVALTPRKRKQQPTEATANEALSIVPSIKEKTLPPPFESGLKTDYPEEAPKLMHEISKVSKTQALTITHFSAADKGPYGCIWQIYIEAEDPEGDMDRISVEVDQVNYGHYPTEWIKLKPQYRKHLTGFLQWNTFSSKAPYLPEGTQISVKISIFDQAGNKSNEVIIPFTFESGVTRRYHAPAPFNQGNIPRIGYVMVDLSAIL